MKMIYHKSLQALENSAKYDKKGVYETPICWSYRVYEKGQTKYFHVFYK